MHPQYNPSKVHAFVHDLTKPEDLQARLQDTSDAFETPFDTSQGVDLISCIFVLSAIPPEKLAAAVKGLVEVRRTESFVI